MFIGVMYLATLKAMSVLLSWLIRVWVRTYRVQLSGPEPPASAPLIFAFHHGRQMGLLRYPRPARTTVMTSLSRDGTLQANLLARLGFEIVRGSSSRRGEAGLLALVRALKRGSAAAMAVDGPKGPRGQVKPGVAYAARAARGLIVPVTVAASRAVVLSKSWDRFMIPLPWSRVVLLRGAPIEVRTDGGDEAIEAAGRTLESRLSEITGKAEELVGPGSERETRTRT